MTNEAYPADSGSKVEMRFELLVAGISDYAIYMLSPEGIVVSWNSGAERFKGYKAEEIIGQHFSRFYSEEDRKAGREEGGSKGEEDREAGREEGRRKGQEDRKAGGKENRRQKEAALEEEGGSSEEEETLRETHRMSKTIRTTNTTDSRRVWITIYNGVGHHVGSDWCEFGAERDWGPYDVFAGPYKVRGEVKSDVQGDDPTIYDTNITLSPSESSVTIVKGDGNYFWELPPGG